MNDIKGAIQGHYTSFIVEETYPPTIEDMRAVVRNMRRQRLFFSYPNDPTSFSPSPDVDVFHMPNRSSVDNSLNNHRTLDGMDHPHARLVAKIRTALCNLPASRQDEYLKSLRLI